MPVLQKEQSDWVSSLVGSILSRLRSAVCKHTTSTRQKPIFRSIVDAAANGETTIIVKAGVPVAKLVPITAPRRRGMLRGVTFNADVSQALGSEIADMFEYKE